jgi:pimeloyl-ACP methyl ester carboxylesterase
MIPELPPVVRRLDALSGKQHTRCGAGSMIWRSWGAGSILVLLHGGYGAWTHWIRNIEPLAERHTVIAPDMPGLGESAMPDEPYGAESLAAVMTQGLTEILPLDATIQIVGFSFGGVLGGHVAAQLGARVRSLLLVGAGGFGPPQPEMSDLQRARPGIAPEALTALQKRNLGILMFADPRRIDDLAVVLQTVNAPRGRIRSRPIAWTDTLLRVLPAVSGRVDALWGACDVTAVPYLDERAARLRAVRPETRIEIVPGAGHWVQYEAAAEFNARLPRLLAAPA